jgi:Chaperone of endosialidase
MNPSIHLKKATPSFVVPFVLTWFALAPQARATCQEGCLPNSNTVLGEDVLISSTGYYNTAMGYHALKSNTTGGANTANGDSALYSNSTGSANTAIGREALSSNTTGSAKTAAGVDALALNTTGVQNTANGGYALQNNTTGSSNIAVGFNAGVNLTTGSNNIDIGKVGVAGESKHIRIGTSGTQTKTFIAWISGTAVPGGVGVIVGTNGQLGTVVSSERFKDAIKPMDKASEAILALQPVTFRYKHELDPDGIPQFGLVAEDVEKVHPDLVARDERGKPYTVRYEAVNAMLLNEFLKEHRKVEEQEAMITKLKSAVAQQQKVAATWNSGN